MKTLMVQGTGSGAGKSLLVAGLARLFANRGLRVAPFKAQNMALNSHITASGGEIGRAQALQAVAARTEPLDAMNPILLKATGEAGCQVIVNGRVYANMKARDYYAAKSSLWPHVETALGELKQSGFDLLLIEGAGSPAEINLSSSEIVNMRVARHLGAPVLLVGDIERGGVFASLFGTVALLEKDAERIKGFVINKFRGDKSILDPGLDTITEKTGIPVAGVIPWARDMGLLEEDGLCLDTLGKRPQADSGRLRVVVAALRFISNFTDLDPLAMETDVDLHYSSDPREMESADMIIIPGTKNTLHDLELARESGLADAIVAAAGRGVAVAGLCGGYQMMGRWISDPEGVEGPPGSGAPGLGLLDIETTMAGGKVTSRCEARPVNGRFASLEEGAPLTGYEIHMGRSTGGTGLFRVRRTAADLCGNDAECLDGSAKGSAWGTYLHGIFENDGFRRAVLDELREQKGLPPLGGEALCYAGILESNIERWAALLGEHLDMELIEEIAGL